MKLEFHHLGYAVKSIERSLDLFEFIGFAKEGELTRDDSRDVKIQFIRKNDILFELIEPANNDSPVSKILRKNGPIPYHFCLISDSIDNTIKELRGKGFVLFDKIKPAPAINNRNVTFLFNKDIGIIELLEG